MKKIVALTLIFAFSLGAIAAITPPKSKGGKHHSHKKAKKKKSGYYFNFMH